MDVSTRPASVLRWVGLFVSLSLPLSTLQAGTPSLSFDFGRTVECRAIADTDSTKIYPGDKLIELKLRVSVHLLSGNISDVEEVRIEIVDCDRLIRVDSFAPNTRLDSDYSKDITVTQTSEKGKTFGASLGGEAPIPFGDVVAHVLPSVNGGFSNREVHTEKQVRKAPQYAVIASGTIQQEHGVFFKLRASSQSTLEGTHELIVRFTVPQNWRGDSLRVCCHATGQEKFLWTRQQTTWASTCAPLAVYLAGDLEARTAAELHVRKNRG